jgi:hypothetical protein
VGNGGRRHRHDDAVEQLVVTLVVRAGVEKFFDGQQFVGRFHALKLAWLATGFHAG